VNELIVIRHQRITGVTLPVDDGWTAW